MTTFAHLFTPFIQLAPQNVNLKNKIKGLYRLPDLGPGSNRYQYIEQLAIRQLHCVVGREPCNDNLFNIENLVLRARSALNRFAGKDCELFWSTGAPQLRIWECGLRNSQIVFELRLCIFNPKSEISNPKCDDSSRLPQRGKTIEAPSGGSQKPGPLGPDSLLTPFLVAQNRCVVFHQIG